MREGDDSGEALPIFLAELTNYHKKHCRGKVPEVDEICPEMLKALDVVGSHFLKRSTGCAQIIGVSDCCAFVGNLSE